MKKALLLLAVSFAAGTFTFAQTGGLTDSTKQQPVAVTDSAKVTSEIKPAVDADTIRPHITYIPTCVLRPTPKPIDQASNPMMIASVSDNALQAALSKKILVQMAFVDQDTVKTPIPQRAPTTIDRLKDQLALVTNDTLRARYYQKLANYYLRYDSITIRKTRQSYQEAAIEFTMKALHSYSKLNDTPGLITSFDNLVKVYKDQRKFSQAKWFVLQSNTMSRQKNDASRIISTLVELAGIKMSIKDYALAKRDLDEALALSTTNHFPKQESEVQASYAALYDHLNQPQMSVKAMKRHDAIEDSIVKANAAEQMAAVKTQDSIQDSKKKLLTSVSKKPSKISSSKKTVSL